MPIILKDSKGIEIISPITITAEPLELLIKLPEKVCAVQGDFHINSVPVIPDISITKTSILITTETMVRFRTIQIASLIKKCSFMIKFWYYNTWQSLSMLQPKDVYTLDQTDNIIRLDVDTHKIFLELVEQNAQGIWFPVSSKMPQTETKIKTKFKSVSYTHLTLPTIYSV